MGIQQGVNAISAGVLGAAVAGKHLQQQKEAVKGAEIRELAGIDREIADKNAAAKELGEKFLEANKAYQDYDEKMKPREAELEKKIQDRRLSSKGDKYWSYAGASAEIQLNKLKLRDAREAAKMRLESAINEQSIYENRKEELEKKYGKYKWYQSK